jgi:hypothetical protein
MNIRSAILDLLHADKQTDKHVEVDSGIANDLKQKVTKETHLKAAADTRK